MVGVNWLNFAPSGDHLWQADYIANYLVDIIMIPTFFGAVAVFALGLKRFMADMHANALAEGKTDKEKIDPAGFMSSADQDRTDHFQAPQIQPSAPKTGSDPRPT
jgi:quinone-modifying oxidoreductase subunit QmoC